MTARIAVGLGLAAAFLTAIAIFAGERPLNTVALPVILLLLTIGPFALLYLALPAVVYPLLVAKFPLTRRKFPGIGAVTIPALAGSAAYLILSAEYTGNAGREPAISALLVVTLALVTLAGVAYLHESKVLTLIYHAVLTVWFFAAAFPYLGEFP